MQDEGFLVVRYLYEQRPDGRYIPSVSVQVPGKAEAIIITDPEGRTYRDLNLALGNGLLAAYPLASQARAQVAGRGHADVTLEGDVFVLIWTGHGTAATLGVLGLER